MLGRGLLPVFAGDSGLLFSCGGSVWFWRPGDTAPTVSQRVSPLLCDGPRTVARPRPPRLGGTLMSALDTLGLSEAFALNVDLKCGFIS